MERKRKREREKEREVKKEKKRKEKKRKEKKRKEKKINKPTTKIPTNPNNKKDFIPPSPFPSLTPFFSPPFFSLTLFPMLTTKTKNKRKPNTNIPFLDKMFRDEIRVKFHSKSADHSPLGHSFFWDIFFFCCFCCLVATLVSFLRCCVTLVCCCLLILVLVLLVFFYFIFFFLFFLFSFLLVTVAPKMSIHSTPKGNFYQFRTAQPPVVLAFVPKRIHVGQFDSPAEPKKHQNVILVRRRSIFSHFL